MKLVGSCTNCGFCCGECEFLRWQLIRLENGKTETRSHCSQWGWGAKYLSGCDRFPDRPRQMWDKPFCGYKWVEDDDGR